MTIYNELLSASRAKEKWARIGARKRAGVLAPLFSVYSKNSTGIGDFNDLKMLVDWCRKTSNSILQLLPMNELSITLCPYDAVSSFAIEPAYIALGALPGAAKKAMREKIEDLRVLFPRTNSHVDYQIREEKLRLLRVMFNESDDLRTAAFKRFLEETRYWLDDFAVYKALKAHHLGVPWYDWKDCYRYRDAKAIAKFYKEHEREVMFHKWVQWVAYTQFRDVRAYANTHNVFIKGDLPILISRDSADVWVHTNFFKLDCAAGAPPDMYCSKGQRWGMPTYDWPVIAEDDYRYVRARLRYAENFYDMIRVDHVVGLFRIWSIPSNEPLDNEGMNGCFDPWNEGEWGEHGSRVLTMMDESTSMLLCAEDLGVIPSQCPPVLREFGIPGNDVQRWVKDWAVRHTFLAPDEYRPLSVAMLSTHDTTNWAAWWEDEAGTVDEPLFARKLGERGVDFNAVRDALFDPELSRHGRLRWRAEIDAPSRIAEVIGKGEWEIGDLSELHANSYCEKEKLWDMLKLRGRMREKCDCEIIKAVSRFTMNTASIFCIELITDRMLLADAFTGDPYLHRINRPGTLSKENWSLMMPLSLDELLLHKVNHQIKDMVIDSGRG